ncbi:protease [Dehalobacter sp. TBBPA1]|uniref:protease n=1 Tax=Dehalobacter sp. TBBPA1 TaxID=3235037 RepID=UPI0034A47529
MHEFYWVCLIGGVLFAFVTIIFGDILGNFFDGLFDTFSMNHLDFLQPMVLVGGITVLGGSGIMLNRYTRLEPLPVAVISLAIAVLVSVIVFFAYVKPMKNCENSSGFSMNDLVGKIGDVSVPIPAGGYGEVVMKIGAGLTNQIAANMTQAEIPDGTRIVVGEVKDGILYVFPFE